jgi:hypothetical protein
MSIGSRERYQMWNAKSKGSPRVEKQKTKGTAKENLAASGKSDSETDIYVCLGTSPRFLV